VNKA